MLPLAFLILGLAILSFVSGRRTGQIPLDGNLDLQFENHHNEPGFKLDLNNVRLVQFSLNDEPVWMTEREKLRAKAMGRKYLDITDSPMLGPSNKKRHFSYPPPSSQLVKEILPLLSTVEPEANLKQFTSFRTRYYNSDTGKASSQWLLAKAMNYTTELASDTQKEMISVKPFKHSWKQDSVIIRIAPNITDSDESEPITVLGAHCDSINHFNPYLPAPGADDDGSGVVTLLEAYRALLVANYTPVSPLEFHFYAAEEGGGLGSLAIVADYEAANKSIKGMQQFDMTAWLRSGTREEIAVITNVVDPDLTHFQKQLIDRYLDIPWVESVYPGNAGSDHFSWTRAGYQACHPLEGAFVNGNHHHIHSEEDRIDISPEFSFDHMLHFSKLAVAFAVELSSY